MMQPGQLCVWWIPQVPMEPFRVEVESPKEAIKLLLVLAEYDQFQLDHNIKPDYCNAGGLSVWSHDCDGEGTHGWEDWHDSDGNDIDSTEEVK